MDKLRNKLFGIECNFGELNGIDFKKGCYVGQENTSRIKLKNKLSKRLLPIKIIEGNISEGDSILDKDLNIGKILIDKYYPFALIKFTDDEFNPFSKRSHISQFANESHNNDNKAYIHTYGTIWDRYGPLGLDP